MTAPRPSAGDIDTLIERLLAAWDAVPRPTRDAAGIVGAICMQLPPERALALLATAARLRERGELEARP